MNIEYDINNEEAKTNSIENYYIKKDLIHVGDMVAKMIFIILALELFLTVIGEGVLNIINRDITTANLETYELIITCIASLTANVLAYFWLMKRTSTPLVSMRPSNEKQTKYMFKWICIVFTAQVLGLLCYECIQLVSRFAGVTWGGFGMDLSVLSYKEYIPYIIWVCLIAPVTEEMVFRGALLKVLSPYGSKSAIIISAVLFGAIHGNLQQFPIAFLLGLLFGFISIKTGTIFYTIILHMFNNAYSVTDELLGVITKNSTTYFVVILGTTIIGGLIGTFFLYKEREEYIKLSSGTYDDFAIPVKRGVTKCFFKSFWIRVLMFIMILICMSSVQKI